MNLIYFTKDAYKALKVALPANESKYYSSDPWMDEFFASVGLQEYLKTSSVVVPDVHLVYNGDDDATKNSDDLTNIRFLYGAYKDKITPMQASDPMLWSALSHVTFKSYVLQRWQKGDGEINLGQRFFATEGRASLCYYNAISRLWWAGYLSYDESKESTDPWHLTKTLLSAQQVLKDFSDQGFSMSRTVAQGLLVALRRIQEESGNNATNVFRKCCDSYLNHYGAVTILDVLEPSEIEGIAFDYMKKQL